MDDLKQVKSILKKIKSAKVAVYGDFCIDACWILDPQGGEISVESGLKAAAVDTHTYSLGGAANIVANLAALEPAYIMTIGVIGDDIFGREIIRQLNKLGADTQGLMVPDHEFGTYAYCKQYIHGKQKPRVDFGSQNTRSSATDDVLIEYLEKALTHCQVLVFNQQIEGSIPNSRFLKRAGELFKSFPDKTVLLDSRHYSNQLNHVCLKANQIEIAWLNSVHAKPGDSIPLHETRIHARHMFDASQKPVFVTCGKNGLLVADSQGLQHIPGIEVIKKIDPVGAGDTITSALAMSLGVDIRPAAAARFANIAAAVTIQKLFQTRTASGEEICGFAEDIDYVFRPDLADDIGSATYLEKTQIELCTSLDDMKLGNIKHVLFDHDGTINTLHEGWPAMMEEMMLSAIIGDRSDSIEANVYQSVVDHVRGYIDSSTGIQTILQMEALVEMVRDFGFIPENEILNKFQYKEIFKEKLFKVVDQRIDSLNKKCADVSDYTLRGVVDFLAKLSQKGITLYLASGSDLKDTRRDAELLGYAHYFNGGIYGSVDDVTKFSKKLLIEKIIEKHNLSGQNLAVFGDGPVEIRECRKQGGVAIGVASDEIRRYGLNASKRSRLIRAGCDIVIPDFSQSSQLLDLLF